MFKTSGPIYRLAASSILLLSIASLSGCARLKVVMGMRISLAKTPVGSMEASLPKGPAIAPGEKLPLVVAFAEANGKTVLTEGAGKGKVEWRDVAITAQVVTVDKKGNISLPRDPRLTEGKTGHIIITVPSHPDLHTELDIPLTYSYNFISSFAGQSGSNGIDGVNGYDGTSGSPGSIDPNTPSAGENGSSGGNGTDGGNGGDGGPGPAVQIRMALKAGSPALLQIGVLVAGHKERFYLVDPQGGSLTVKSLGGAGGRGGTGGRGGHGGSGGIGSPSGSSGSDGVSGSDGHSGSDGRGGPITVTYDPLVKPYLAILKLQNPGGPAPVIQEQSVSPLW